MTDGWLVPKRCWTVEERYRFRGPRNLDGRGLEARNMALPWPFPVTDQAFDLWQGGKLLT